MKLPRRFFTSDLHLWHRLPARHRGFGDDVQAHADTLAQRWDENVRDIDTVWVLGDLTVSKLTDSLDWISDRPGTKHFVSGNHDGCHPMHRRWPKVAKRFQMVFETVQPLAAVRLEGQSVLLSHFPYGGLEGADHTKIPRYTEWRPREDGMWLLHGHTHMANQRRHGHQIHVGVDAWDLTPVHEDKITELMREGTPVTWTCMVCGEERPDEVIDVAYRKIKGLEDLFPETRHNVRFCSDRAACASVKQSTEPWTGRQQ